MLQAIWVLTRARLQITRNSLWRGKLGQKLGLVALVALVGLGSFGLYQFVGFIVGGLRSEEFARAIAAAAEQVEGLPSDVRPFLNTVPSLALFTALLLLVFSSFSGLLSSLFLSGDIDMLLAAPVPMRAVFTVKFFGGIWPQYLALFALLGPVLVGFGQGMGYGPLYFGCVLLTLLLVPLLPAGLGALLVMAVVRVLPARRAREIVSILGGLIGVAFWLLTQFSGEIAPSVAQPGNLRALLASNFPLLPSAWAGRALVAAGEGQTLPLLFFGGIFLASSLAVFGGCLLLAERLYYEGWSNMATQGGRVRARRPEAADEGRAARPSPLRPLVNLMPAQSRTILAKDLKLFLRDLRNLQQLIFPLAVAGIWLFRLFSDPPASELPGDTPAWALEISDLLSSGIAFFICVSLSSALAGSGVSREGRGYWILKLAPVSPWRLLLGKLALAYLPYPTVGTFFLVVLAIFAGLSPLVFLQQLALLLLAGLGSASFSMGLGASFPRLDWENPQQQTTWQSGCIGAVVLPLYLVALLALVLGGGLLGDLLGGGASGLAAQLVGWVLGVGLTALVCWLSILMGVRGLERIEV